MAKYPIVHQPTEAFMELLKRSIDPEWEVADLKFYQWANKRWSAVFLLGRKGAITAETTLGGAEPSLADIEKRLIKWLR